VSCPACRADTHPHDLLKIRSEAAAIHRCARCGLLFFPEPRWLEAAYTEPISDIDVGLATRCVNAARIVEAVVRAERLGSSRHLDFGGGYGLLTRLARDRGIDMLHHDPLAYNLFAQGFEGTLEGNYGLVSLIEVLEHLTDPAEQIQAIARRCELILVSTFLIPRGMHDLRGWWYLLPELGQHVTFYTENALGEIARRAGLMLTSNRESLHLFHRHPLRPLTRLIIRDPRVSPMVGSLLRFRDRARSLREPDSVIALERFAARSGHSA
jgi:hypothetical protein